MCQLLLFLLGLSVSSLLEASYLGRSPQRHRQVMIQSEVFDTKLFRRCNLTLLDTHPPETIPFNVPLADEYVGAKICMHGNYDAEKVSTFLAYIKPGSTVVDAGGNLGAYSVQFAHKVGPQGRVVVFEPQPMIFHLLLSNLLSGGLGNVVAHHTALGFKVGRTSMGSKLPDGPSTGQDFQQAMDSAQKINFGGRALGRGGELVPMRTLDFFNLTNISFIKIDVQGSENLLMWGAKETILRERPVVNIELGSIFTERMTQPDSVKALGLPPEVVSFRAIDWLKSVGYELFQMVREDTIMVYKPESNPNRESNDAKYEAHLKKAQNAQRYSGRRHVVSR